MGIAGAVGGVYNAWSGSFDTILPHSIVSTDQCGILGLVSTVAYCFGGFAVGPVMDRMPFFKQRFKLLLLLLLLASALLFTWFTLSLPIPGSSETLLPASFGTLAAAIVLCGFFLGATNPIYYTMGVELTFPVSEGTSAGVVSLFNNVGALVLLAAKNAIAPASNNVMMTCTVALTLLAVLPLKETYKRLDYEQACSSKAASDVEYHRMN